MRLSVEAVDRHRVLTVLAAVGILVGVALAVFGLPPVDTHTPLHHVGIMMPTCGGTRALRLTMLGRWEAAWAYNPLSVVLAAGAVLTLLRALVGWTTGRWLTVRLAGPGWAVLIVISVVAVVLLEINQQAHALLLMGS